MSTRLAVSPIIVRTCIVATGVIASAFGTACAGERSASPTAPTTAAMAASREQEGDLRFPRSGDLRVTKECSEYSGLAGSFCTITASNVDGIGVGSKVIYTRAAGATSIESDIIIDPPGRGSKAFGHVALDFTTGRGLVTLSGGTGKFTHLRASAVVSYLGGPSWAWLGSYRFGSKDD